MKHLLLAFILLSNLALGVSASVKITASGGSPIPATYTTGSQSLVLQALPGSVRHVVAFNDTSDRIALTVAHDSPAYAPSNVKEVFLPASSGIVLDEIGTTAQVYLRSDSGATITSGRVYISVY